MGTQGAGRVAGSGDETHPGQGRTQGEILGESREELEGYDDENHDKKKPSDTSHDADDSSLKAAKDHVFHLLTR